MIAITNMGILVALENRLLNVESSDGKYVNAAKYSA